MERLQEWDDGACELSAQRAVWRLCTFRAHATHAYVPAVVKVLVRIEAGSRLPESDTAGPQETGVRERLDAA